MEKTWPLHPVLSLHGDEIVLLYYTTEFSICFFFFFGSGVSSKPQVPQIPYSQVEVTIPIIKY